MTKAKTKEREPAPDLLLTAGVEAEVLPPNPVKASMPAVKPTRGKRPSQEVSTEVRHLPTASPRNLLEAIVQAAADPKCQPEKMHALLDARDRLMRQEAEVAFMTAYIEMQEELPEIDAKGRIEIPAKPGARSQKAQNTPYATYQEINRVTKPILRRHKFGMLMLPDVGPNNVGILMRGKLLYVCDTPYGKLVHAENCAIAVPLETSGSKNNVQGTGSSLSYTKRYCAVALLNLVSKASEDKDDDGQAAGKRGAKPEPEAEEIVFASKLQIDEMMKAIEDCGVGLEVVCNKYQVDALRELPADKVREVIQACATFKANQEAKRSHG